MLFSVRLSRVVGLISLFVAVGVAGACSDPLQPITHQGDVTTTPTQVDGADETIEVDPDAILVLGHRRRGRDRRDEYGPP